MAKTRLLVLIAPLQEVSVTAQRAQLAQRVTRFIDQIAVLEKQESLPRWHDPVCPSVSGLPQQEGEYLLGRFAEIARAAAVPLAGAHCRVALMVLLTPQPVELLPCRTSGISPWCSSSWIRGSSRAWRAQLAEFVAMVSLAQIRPGAQLGDAPRILKLFDGVPQSAPAGLSNWDLAFLKSLYGTEHKSRIPRSWMTKTTVREITH